MMQPVVNRSKGVFIAVFHFFAVFSLLAQTAYSGVLDPNFGTGGRVTVDFPFSSSGNYTSAGHRVFVQPSGRIVGVGSHAQPGGKGGMMMGIAMAGLTQAGTIDTFFGGLGNGKRLIWDPGYFTSLYDAQMLRDGRILHLSRTMTLLGGVFLELVRTNEDGTRDTGFAPDLNVGGSVLGQFPVKFSVQDDGKINVLVYRQESGNRYYLIRFRPDGSRDTTFGTGGVREITRLAAVPGRVIISVKSLPNGKTLICGSPGTAQTAQPRDFLFVLRLDSNGDADHSFGALGLAKITFAGQTVFANDLLVQPDGKYVIVGAIRNPDPDSLLVRLTQRGKTDGRFGNAGVVVTDFTPGSDDYGFRATLTSSGKIIVAGLAGLDSTTPKNFLVARYSSGGALEAHTQTAFTPSQNSAALDVTIQPDGKILVIGYTGNPNPSVAGNVFAFARYTDITND